MIAILIRRNPQNIPLAVLHLCIGNAILFHGNRIRNLLFPYLYLFFSGSGRLHHRIVALVLPCRFSNGYVSPALRFTDGQRRRRADQHRSPRIYNTAVFRAVQIFLTRNRHHPVIFPGNITPLLCGRIIGLPPVIQRTAPIIFCFYGKPGSSSDRYFFILRLHRNLKARMVFRKGSAADPGSGQTLYACAVYRCNRIGILHIWRQIRHLIPHNSILICLRTWNRRLGKLHAIVGNQHQLIDRRACRHIPFQNHLPAANFCNRQILWHFRRLLHIRRLISDHDDRLVIQPRLPRPKLPVKPITGHSGRKVIHSSCIRDAIHLTMYISRGN